MSNSKTEVKRKRIVINFRGPIQPKAGAYGPILTPYYENMQTINALVTGGYNVEEVLSTGKRVKLTLENANEDNDVEAKANAEKAAKEAEAKAKAEKEAAEKAAKEAQRKAAEEAAAKAKADAEANKKIEDNTKRK